MRRVRSAPIRLSMMPHRSRRKSPRNSHALPKADTRTGEGDAISEIVYAVSEKLNVSDHTEELLIYIVARSLSNMECVAWETLLVDICKRLAASYVTHLLISMILEYAGDDTSWPKMQ